MDAQVSIDVLLECYHYWWLNRHLEQRYASCTPPSSHRHCQTACLTTGACLSREKTNQWYVTVTKHRHKPPKQVDEKMPHPWRKQENTFFCTDVINKLCSVVVCLSCQFSQMSCNNWKEWLYHHHRHHYCVFIQKGIHPPSPNKQTSSRLVLLLLLRDACTATQGDRLYCTGLLPPFLLLVVVGDIIAVFHWWTFVHGGEGWVVTHHIKETEINSPLWRRWLAHAFLARKFSKNHGADYSSV